MLEPVIYVLLLLMIVLTCAVIYLWVRFNKLSKSDEAMAQAFEITREGIYFLDLAKNQTRVGDSYYRLLGYEPGAFQFEQGIWSSLIHPEDREQVLDAYQNVAEQSDTFVSIQYRLLKESGEYIWVLDRSRVVKYSGDGKPVCSIGTITEIQQLKQAEELIQEKNEQLEKTLRELKESQTQIVEMEKMATLGLLTSGIAYELNNPLNYVKGNVHPLKNDFREITEFVSGVLNAPPGSESEVARQIASKYNLTELIDEVNLLLDGIEEGAQKSSEIVKTLKMFSDDQNSEIPMLLDLHENIDSAVRLLHGRFGDKIAINKRYGAIQQVNGWPGKLNQVFTNLLSNAIDAIGHDDYGEITITTFQDKDQVKVRIEDDGCGIKPGLEDQIFEPFFTTKKGSNGLGLSIVATVMKSHSGSVSVQKNDGSTCFELTIPVSLQIA